MSVPSNIVFPRDSSRLNSENKIDREAYMQELIFTLENMYERLAYGINGDIKSDAFTVENQFTPILTEAGNTALTFTYDHQTAWVLRQGIIVDVWFDIQVTGVDSGTAGTGALYLELPYKVALSSNMPFVGVVQPSNLTYTSGSETVINAIPNTFRGEFWNCGTGVATAVQAANTDAAFTLIGHIRYIGQENEYA